MRNIAKLVLLDSVCAVSVIAQLGHMAYGHRDSDILYIKLDSFTLQAVCGAIPLFRMLILAYEASAYIV